MSLTDRINRKPRKVEPCRACGSESNDPATHKTWCSVRILEPSLHRFMRAADLTRLVVAS
jgi:hypothetical protein